MPIYEYVCEKCGDHSEVIQKVTDQPLKRCTKCRGKLEKIYSRTSFQLKGSGWYKTDYSGSSPGSKPKAKEEKKTETKSEAKTESSSKGTGGRGGSGGTD